MRSQSLIIPVLCRAALRIRITLSVINPPIICRITAIIHTAALQIRLQFAVIRRTALRIRIRFAVIRRAALRIAASIVY